MAAVSATLFLEHPLPWKRVGPGGKVRLDRKDDAGRIFLASDHCLLDKDGYEVLAASEYLRCDPAVLDFICQTVNHFGALPD